MMQGTVDSDQLDFMVLCAALFCQWCSNLSLAYDMVTRT